jgi:hypothetical protein
MMKEFCFLMSVTGLNRSNIGKDKNDDDDDHDDEEAYSINFHPRVFFFFHLFLGSQCVC